MRKVFKVVIPAICFGLIAGLVMVGVVFLSKDLTGLFKKETTVTAPITPIATMYEAYNATSTENVGANIKEYVPQRGYTIVELVENTMPSIVSITNMQKFQQNGFSIFPGFRTQPQTYEAPAAGSGVIVQMNDEEIIMLTNNHVVENSSSMTVTFNGNETVDAAIKGTDAKKDLAIISVKKENVKKEILGTLKVANIGNSDNLKVGEQVVAIGNALGVGQAVTTGIISAKDRVIDGIDNTEALIQTDAAINPGNSGGALLNMKGQLIGINVAKSSGNAIEGIGYAIPVNSALDVIETLSVKKDRTAIPEEEQGYLGIVVKNIDSATAESLGMPEGIYVYQIQKDSAAARSNLKEKDIIVEFDDQAVKTNTDLSELVSFTRFDQEVSIKVKRLVDGEYVEKKFTVKMGKRPVEEKEEEKKETKKEVDPKINRGYDGSGGYYIDPFEDFFGDNFFRGFGLW